jgi:hypothetical protein
MLLLAFAGTTGTGLCQVEEAEEGSAPESAGWQKLFDGQDLSQWRGLHDNRIHDQIWQIKEGLLCVQPNRRWGDDIISSRTYDNFELRFEWRISPEGNSGVKYLVREEWQDPTRVRLRYGSLWGSIALGFLIIALVILLRDRRLEPRRPLLGILLGIALFLGLFAFSVSLFQRGPGTSAVGLEFQLFDAPGTFPSSTKTSGALYDLLAPIKDAARPAGTFNEGRIVVRGTRIEHWVNGIRVLEFDLDSEEFRRALGASKFSGLPFDTKRPGYISLQNHMNGVCFRRIQIQDASAAQ